MTGLVLRQEIIDITPDRSLFPKIGKSGYTLTQSIAELVDNAIDARLPDTILLINIVIQNDFIIVEDNGVGMDRTVAETALRLGYSKKKNALGEFGLGLKSACTSIGSRFTIRTYPIGKNEGCEFVFDEDKWNTGVENTWKDRLTIFEKEQSKSGTWLKIESPRRKINKQRRRDVLLDFGKRFAPFIQAGEARIFVNKTECKPEDIELTDDGRKEFQIRLGSNRKLSGWYGLMKKGSIKGHYGFSTFRRGRMITCYDKIGIPQHPTISKIVGEIHMDHVPVAHNKKEFETESEEYTEAAEVLKKEFDDIVRKARNSSLDSKVDETVKNATESWKEAIIESFHRDVKDLVDSPQTRKKSLDNLDPIGEVIIEKRDQRLQNSIRQAIEKNRKIRNPRDKNQVVVSHFITIEGKNYKVNHVYARLGENSGWKQFNYSANEGVIDVITNQDFPAYAVTKDISFYAAIHIAESIAEIVGRVNDFEVERVGEIKETLLRRASEIVEEFKEQLSTSEN